MHTEPRSPNEIAVQILTVSVTENLQLKPTQGQGKGQEEVNRSGKDFDYSWKVF